MKQLIIILNLLLPVAASAQVPPAYRADYNRMMKNNQFRSFNNFMNTQRLSTLKGNFSSSNYKWDFTVKFKDSTTITVNSRFKFDEIKNAFYLEKINHQLPRADSNRTEKIFPSQTIAIERTDVVWNHTQVGEPMDSCWLFWVMDGKINVFSYFSEEASVMEGVIAAIQYDDGPLEKFDAAKLGEVIKDNAKAIKAFGRKEYYNAIKIYNRSNKNE